MKLHRLAALAAFSGLSAAASSAMALPANTVTIAFSGPATVPLSPITLVVLAVGVAGLAMAFIGRRQGWRMMAPGLAMVLGATAVFTASEVRADAAELDLVTSGDTFELTSLYNDFTNKTGATITLTTVTPVLQQGFSVRSDANSCAVGVTLAPGEVCVFNLRQPV